MGMFGGGFGKASPWSIDERGAIPLPTLPTSDTSLPATSETHRAGFFSPNGAGVNIFGGLADGLATALGGQPIYAPAQQARQQRQYQIEDEERKARIAAQYRQPQAPHFFEANDGSQGAIDPQTGEVRILYKDPTPKVDYTPVKNADGTTTLYPTINGQLVGQPQSAQPATGLPQGFTVRPKGGAASQAGTPFPLRPLMR